MPSARTSTSGRGMHRSPRQAPFRLYLPSCLLLQVSGKHVQRVEEHPRIVARTPLGQRRDDPTVGGSARLDGDLGGSAQGLRLGARLATLGPVRALLLQGMKA